MSLPRLPNELLISIAKNLDLRSLSWLLRTNHLFNSLLTPLLHGFVAQERDGQPTLYWAVRRGHKPLVTLLLEKLDRADPMNIAYEQFALILAVRDKNVGMVKLLLENKVDTEGRQRPSRRTPLSLATFWGTAEIVQLLLDYGANTEAQGFEGHTALHQAAVYGDEVMFMAMLKKGANIDARGFSGRTPLHEALIRSGATGEAIARILVERGANINARASSGYSAIDLAMASQSESIIQLLLEKGATTNPEANEQRIREEVWDCYHRENDYLLSASYHF